MKIYNSIYHSNHTHNPFNINLLALTEAEPILDNDDVKIGNVSSNIITDTATNDNDKIDPKCSNNRSKL